MDQPKDPAAIAAYHAHIYYDALSRDRAARLRDAGAASAAAFHASLIGQEAFILAETEQGGHTEHFAPVRVHGVPGHLMRARITEADARGLIAIAA